MAAPPGRGTGCFEGNSIVDPPGPSPQSYCASSALTRSNGAQMVMRNPLYSIVSGTSSTFFSPAALRSAYFLTQVLRVSQTGQGARGRLLLASEIVDECDEGFGDRERTDFRRPSPHSAWQRDRRRRGHGRRAGAAPLGAALLALRRRRRDRAGWAGQCPARPIRRQTPLRPAPQGLQMARLDA